MLKHLGFVNTFTVNTL